MSQWKELFGEIVTTDVCCGCAACVLVCPHHVLDYDFGMEKPYQTDELAPDNCSHGETGCDLCARACPRLDNETGLWRHDWPELERMLFGRTRERDETIGVYRHHLLARASDPDVCERGQDGGVGSAIILHGLATGALDGAAVSGFDGNQMTEPKLVTTRDEVLGTARSRYTYCATPLALRDAWNRKLRKIAMVGVSCEVSAAPMMAMSGVRKWSNRIALTVGLMCSETFLPEPFLVQKLQGEYGIDMSRVAKINIKGKIIVTMDDGRDVDISLDECRGLARDWGCTFCPDFGAEHADISLGGLGMEGWSYVVIRTERGETYWNEMVDAGVVDTRPADEEPEVVDLGVRLARRQRRRTRNIERWLGDGRVEPFSPVEAEATVKRGSPEAKFRPDGSVSAAVLSQTAMAGASPKGQPKSQPKGEPG